MPADIAKYISYFREQCDKIHKVQDDLHRKILSVSLLSTLAEGRFPKGYRDQHKFTALIEGHTEWQHAGSVSISQLKIVLDTKGDTNHTKLIKRINDEYEWYLKNCNGSISISNDPPEHNLLQMADNDFERKSIGQSKHSYLLYRYRCKLVHEYQEPGCSFHVFSDQSPHYMPVMDTDTGQISLELVYPTQWLLGMLSVTIDTLEAHYLENNINPYDSYAFGTNWNQKRTIR